MTHSIRLTFLALACALALAGCKKAPNDAPADAPAAAPSAQPSRPPAPPAEPTPEEREAAARKAKLDYATMEDGYLNDAQAQWASTARASSSFNEKEPPADPKDSRAWRATGTVDGNTWSQGRQDVGMDWIELGYDKPVHATAVRAVFESQEAVEAITKVDLIDTAGAVQTVWSGISDVKRDDRGERTWFVRTFARSAQPIRAVRLTFANNVASGYKEVDAVQLVGE
ncbi:hypothetical protein [Ideonella sp.]|uniref:hypothetical protein n=1 Tax=Ideonella sp. TaxID=1929293 RepID=UPI0035B1C080